MCHRGTKDKGVELSSLRAPLYCSLLGGRKKESTPQGGGSAGGGEGSPQGKRQQPLPPEIFTDVNLLYGFLFKNFI